MRTTTHLEGTTWRKSTFSSAEGNCVEVAITSTVVGLRDSKSTITGVVVVSPASWLSFLAAVK
jgi:hypothetical protein